MSWTLTFYIKKGFFKVAHAFTLKSERMRGRDREKREKKKNVRYINPNRLPHCHLRFSSRMFSMKSRQGSELDSDRDRDS